MTRRMGKLLLILALAAALLLGGAMLYRHFVTNRIADRGGMENPDVPAGTQQEQDASYPQ